MSPREADAAVGDDRDLVVHGRRDVRHGGDLRNTHACNDARGADGAGTDAHLDAVHAGLHEIARRFGGCDVAADDLQVAPLRLDARDHVEHALGVAVRGVDDHHIDAGFAQRRDSLHGVLRRTHGCADAQATRRILAGARELGGLLEILHGDHAAQFLVAVHHQHLLDAVLVQQQQHFVLRRVFAHGDEPLFWRHDRRHGRVELHLEAQVAMRDDADDLGTLHHRHAGDAFATG